MLKETIERLCSESRSNMGTILGLGRAHVDVVELRELANLLFGAI
jgi:hypothetical protein